MNTQLRKAWESRSPRERTVIAASALVLAAVLYVWFVQSAGRSRVQLHTNVGVLRAQAADFDRQTQEYGRLRAAPAATVSPTSLRTLVQTRIDAAGLSQALVRMEAPDADQVVVVLGAVAFADWLNWIAGLTSQHIRLDACRIEALSKPGLVSVTATLARAKSQ